MTFHTSDPSEFEIILRRVILEAFASGETVEGTWNIESVPDEIPNWSVEITRFDD